MNPLLQVRPATRADLDDLVAFQLQMAWETECLRLSRSIVESGVAAVLSDPAKGAYLVAEHAGRPLASLLTTYEWSDWRNGTVVWIQSVYVVPDWRRRGVFRQLYEYVRRQVEASPERVGIRLYVDKSNLPAQRVYRGLGMDGDHYQVFEWLK